MERVWVKIEKNTDNLDNGYIGGSLSYYSLYFYHKLKNLREHLKMDAISSTLCISSRHNARGHHDQKTSPPVKHVFYNEILTYG